MISLQMASGRMKVAHSWSPGQNGIPLCCSVSIAVCLVMGEDLHVAGFPVPSPLCPPHPSQVQLAQVWAEPFPTCPCPGRKYCLEGF